MELPTLLQVNSTIIKNVSKLEKNRISNITGIEYLLNFISDRMPSIMDGYVKIQPKTIGDKVVIIKSGTGSGKSTIIPPMLYERFQNRTNKNIVITQPRIITTKEITERIPKYYNFMKLDNNLGFSTGDMKRLPTNKGVIYMTSGTLFSEIMHKNDSEIMGKYSFIIIDEIHERGVNIDLLLYRIKSLLKINFTSEKCPFIILMSATIEEKIFINYFDCPSSNYIEFKGSSYEIIPHFPKYDIPNYLNYIIDTIKKIHNDNITDFTEKYSNKDILVFIKSTFDVGVIITEMHKYNSQIFKEHGEKYYILPIELTSHSFNKSSIEYKNLFENVDNLSVSIFDMEMLKIDFNTVKQIYTPSRKVILSTNVAETGITIDTIKYCIDSGFYFSVEYNPDLHVKTLISKDITKGMAIQRKGRVGRLSIGHWYPCYTEDVFKKLSDFQISEISTTDISLVLLKLIITETESAVIEHNKYYPDNKYTFHKNYLSDNSLYLLENGKKLNFSSIDLLEIPSSSSLINSFEKLYTFGFIDSSYNPTILSHYVNIFGKFTIESVRMILSGYAHGANILDLITIASFLTIGIKIIFKKKYKPINMLKMDDKTYEIYYKTIIGDQFIEFVLIWNLYSDFINKNKIDIDKILKWCDQHNLEYTGILKVSKLRDEIINSMVGAGVNPHYNQINIKNYNLLHILQDNLEIGLHEIKKIKRCILDGYRFNLLVWDENVKKYMRYYKKIYVNIFKNNLISRLGDDAIQNNANFIVTSEILYTLMGTNYVFKSSDTISIMDTINIDLNFLYT